MRLFDSAWLIRVSVGLEFRAALNRLLRALIVACGVFLDIMAAAG